MTKRPPVEEWDDDDDGRFAGCGRVPTPDRPAGLIWTGTLVLASISLLGLIYYIVLRPGPLNVPIVVWLSAIGGYSAMQATALIVRVAWLFRATRVVCIVFVLAALAIGSYVGILSAHAAAVSVMDDAFVEPVGVAVKTLVMMTTFTIFMVINGELADKISYARTSTDDD